MSFVQGEIAGDKMFECERDGVMCLPRVKQEESRLEWNETEITFNLDSILDASHNNFFFCCC